MNAVTDVLDSAQRQLSGQAGPNRYVDSLEEGRVPKEGLGRLAGELYHLVRSDRRSFALLAARFPAAPAGDLYLAMADGEGEALRLLVDFAGALGLSEQDLQDHEPLPLAQAYPAYLARSALFGAQSDVALALLANVRESGGTYARVADALVSRYGFQEPDVAHFRFFAETPQSLLDRATATLTSGLAAGDDPAAAVRCARTVHALEGEFWDCLARNLAIDRGQHL
ncbi:transcriptional regulator [Actinomycetota bacterium Odt1-20B]